MMLKNSFTFIVFMFFWAGSLIAQKKGAIKAYSAGLEYYNMGNYEAAVPFFEESIKVDQAFIYAHRVLISCYEQLDKEVEAIAAYEVLIPLAPSDRTLPYNLAMSYLEKKDYQKAKVYLKKALAVDPAYGKAANKLKELETYLNRAIKRSELAVEQEEDQVVLQAKKVYNKALVAYRAKDYITSIQLLSSFIEPVEFPDFYYLLAISYQQEGEIEKTIESYERVLEVDDRHFDTNLNLGILLYNQKKFEASVPLLETAHARRKNDRNIIYNLAKAYYYATDYTLAIPQLEQYLKLNTKNGEAWFLLGTAYSKTKSSRKAEQAYTKAKKYGRNDADILDNLEASAASFGKKAGDLSKTGNYQEAINVLEQGVKEHSKAASLHFNLALNYVRVGNNKRAREEFKKTVELDASHGKAYQGLASIYYEREAYSEAAAYYLATIDAGKQDAVVFYKLGNCYFRMNRFKQAIDAYQKSIALNPKEKMFHYALGLSLLRNKSNKASTLALRKALALDPNFLDAQYHICINYIEQAAFKKCILEGEKIIAKDSEYAKAYLVIGHAYKRMGQFGLADKYQKRAERIDPKLKQ